LPELSGLIAKSETQLIGLNTAPGDTAAGEWGLAALTGPSAGFQKALRQALEYAAGTKGSQHSRDGRDDARQASSRRPPYYLANLSSRQRGPQTRPNRSHRAVELD